MTVNRKIFFDGVRPLLGGSLEQATVDALNGVLDAWGKYGDADIRKLSSILGNMKREVGDKMLPVREGFAKTDAEARAYVERHGYSYDRPTNYGGQVAYGRGQIQTTWVFNYEKMDKRLSLNGKLLANFDLALDPVISAQMAVVGMVEGIFTGRKLGDYFTADRSDWLNARRTVNGLDHAEEVEHNSLAFYAVLLKAVVADPAPAPAPAPQPEPAPQPAPQDASGGFWISILQAVVNFIKGN